MKIATIIGARPQFIKSTLLSREIRKYFSEIIIHTGQHYDFELSKIFFDELSLIDPDYNLEIGSGSHATQTGNMLIKIEEILLKEKPDYTLVFGDTNSTLAGALASKKIGIPVIHVEAGMRNNDEYKPEEINRILIDHISNWLFAPTETAVNNLRREGLLKNVVLTGDVNYDLLKYNLESIKEQDSFRKFKLTPKNYYLLTIHKSINTDSKDRLTNILKNIVEIKKSVLFPVHPRTLKEIKKKGLLRLIENSNIFITKPLGFMEFLNLLYHSDKVITDSGGVQKDAYCLGIPCITLRETEWTETVESGWNIVIDSLSDKFFKVIDDFNPSTEQKEIFGDGYAYKKIVKTLNQGK